MRKGRTIFWGVLFLLGALALLVGRLGYLGDIGFWSIFFTIGLIGLLIEGIFNRSFGSILFSLAFLAIVYDEMLGIEAITPWPVLGAALLGTIGLNMLFPKKYKWKMVNRNKQKTDEERVIESVDGEEVRFDVSFGDTVKYVTSKDLSKVRAESSFGNLIIYLDNAELKNNQATVKMDCSFGNISLHIPADWRVIQNMDTAFGTVKEHGHCNPAGINTLYVNGSVSFGSVEIHYI